MIVIKLYCCHLLKCDLLHLFWADHNFSCLSFLSFWLLCFCIRVGVFNCRFLSALLCLKTFVLFVCFVIFKSVFFNLNVYEGCLAILTMQGLWKVGLTMSEDFIQYCPLPNTEGVSGSWTKLLTSL